MCGDDVFMSWTLTTGIVYLINAGLALIIFIFKVTKADTLFQIT